VGEQTVFFFLTDESPKCGDPSTPGFLFSQQQPPCDSWANLVTGSWAIVNGFLGTRKIP
jgi:hypothetical protein